MINLEGLKAIGLAEKKLAQNDVSKQKKLLQEFRSDPEVAHALDYLERFNEVIPESHPVFNRVEELRKMRDGKETVREIIKNKADAKKPSNDKDADEEESERKTKKMKETESVLNGLLENIEKENDRAFEYVNRNLKAFSSEYKKTCQILKLKRFLVSVKNGIREMRIK